MNQGSKTLDDDKVDTVLDSSKSPNDKIQKFLNEKTKASNDPLSLRSKIMLQSLFDDTLFGNTNVLVYEHNDNGSKGFILNTPMNSDIAKAYMDQLKLEQNPGKYKDFKNVHYKLGGPVQLDKKF